MISVLMLFRDQEIIPAKSALLFSSPTLIAGFVYPRYFFRLLTKKACEKIHNKSLGRNCKSRYQNASVTVEASVAFPVFFFAVMYLIQMFYVLRAEVVIAEAGLTAAREAAAYSYVAERLANGENAVAETLLDLFDQKIVQDVAMTAMFHARCDKDILKCAGVAQGFGGIWVNTEASGAKTNAEIYYWVNPPNVWTKRSRGYYVMRLVYRDWTGEGSISGQAEDEEENKTTVYMTEHGSVYHRNRACTYIKIDTTPIMSEYVGSKRNASGAKYYACEFCDPVLYNGLQVYVTEYGTRYHAVSTCSAIKRTVKECDLAEVEQTYRACSKCGKREGGS